ncbi:MAG TPA: BrnA antitoxin family protein [Caulobacteraceae bacterium]|nr:BrnA antitoxin family protein [Caulobacteraceae bacterium]
MASDRKVAFDDENPEWTEADFARGRPGAEVLPPEVLAAFGKRRGRPKVDAPKKAVSLRLDPDVLDHFKATGAGWQRRINAILRRAMERA